MRAFAPLRLFALSLFLVHLVDATAAEPLSKSAAVTLAQKFVAENGYTDLPRGQVKDKLDSESLEWSDVRETILASRFNTLSPIAIGVKAGAMGKAEGWSVAFDYVGRGASAAGCRVVTMDRDGSNIRMQHADGIRTYFAGFD